MCRIEDVLLRHGGLVAVEAVDHDRLAPVLLDARRAPGAANSPGDSSAASTCSMSSLPPSLQALPGRCPAPSARSNSRPSSSSKTNSAACSPRSDARDDELQREQRLAGAGRPEDQGARAALEPAAEQRVELGDAAGQHIARRSPSGARRATRRGKTSSRRSRCVKSW